MSAGQAAAPLIAMPRLEPLRLSTLFVRTLRDDPAGADVASYRLLVRAGYIRRSGPGVFSWLPLGVMVLANVERIVADELDRAGIQQLRLPVSQPPAGVETVRLVKDMCPSYKDLPVSLYHFETRRDDQVRPRGGLLRSRESVVVSSYSFDVDEQSRQASYHAHRAAYVRAFECLGLRCIVAATGSGEAFVVPLEVGDGRFVLCPQCGFSATLEAELVPDAAPPAPDAAASDAPGARAEDTPDTATIEALVDHLNARCDLRRADRAWQAADILKNILIMLTHPDGRREPVAIGLPGDRDLDLGRLESKLAPARAEVFSEAEFAAWPQLVKGYIGPGSLGARRGVRYLLDRRVVDGSSWVTGADAPGRHVIDLVAGRDFRPNGTVDAAEVRDGDPCPSCGDGLELRPGVEIGRLATLSHEADAMVAGPGGRPVLVARGEYGMGVTRTVAAIAETTLDGHGLCWPRSIAPADVHVVAASQDQAVLTFSDGLVEEFAGASMKVLYDDRAGVSAGVKFKDAELIGIPTIVVVGRGLVDGTVEVRHRQNSTVALVRADQVAGQVIALCRAGDTVTGPG